MSVIKENVFLIYSLFLVQPFNLVLLLCRFVILEEPL